MANGSRIVGLWISTFFISSIVVLVSVANALEKGIWSPDALALPLVFFPIASRMVIKETWGKKREKTEEAFKGTS